MKKSIRVLLFAVLLTVSVATIDINADAATAKETVGRYETGLVPTTVEIQELEEVKDVFRKKKSSIYQSRWEKYGSNYFYNHMNQFEKKLYDDLNAMCLYYMEGNENLTDSFTQNCEYFNLNRESAVRVARIFFYSNPQYFYLSTHISVAYRENEGLIKLGVYDAFRNGSARIEAKNQIESAICEYESQIEMVSSATGKQKKIHDLISANISYVANQYDQSIYSALVLKNTVCAGYAGLYSVLCNGQDIDTLVITSDSHAWNYSRINHSWYTIDCTWDDSASGNESTWIYTYFNRSKEELDRNDEDSAHRIETMWGSYQMPKSTQDSGATVRDPGTVHTPSAQVEQPIITRVDRGSYDEITIVTSRDGAKLFYTNDGMIPSEANTKGDLYSQVICVGKQSIVKAIAVSDTFYDSEIVVSEPVVTEDTATPEVPSENPSVDNNLSGGGGNITSPSENPVVVLPPAAPPTVLPVLEETRTDINKCKISGLSNKTYTGKAIKPVIKIQNGSTVLKAGTDYVITYSNNKAIGTAKVMVRGIGKYDSTMAGSFLIVPKKVTITSMKPLKKSVKVNWKKDKTINGYQIHSSTVKNFKKNVTTKTIKKASVSNVTIKKLQSKKRYYVRIRAYKKVGSKTYYGAWSTIKQVNIK